MQRFSMLTICLLAVSTFMATAAHAQNGHFISASDVLVTSGTHAGDLLVSFKESGLGNDTTVHYTAAGSGSSTYACINGGGNHPSASNKITIPGPVSASGTFSSGKNGTISQTLEVEEVGAGTFSCPGGQSLVLAGVTFSGMTISDDLGNAEPVPDQQTTFCDINNLTKATIKNCVTPD